MRMQNFVLEFSNKMALYSVIYSITATSFLSRQNFVAFVGTKLFITFAIRKPGKYSPQ